MHPYDEQYLKTAANTLGKAFDFAEKHLPGGVARFYDLFCTSTISRTFDGPDACPQVSDSGIELVLAVCEGDGIESLETMLSSEKRLPKGVRDRARWCGEALAFHQWMTGASFRAISLYLSADDLINLYTQNQTATPRAASLALEEIYLHTVVPTRLSTFRSVSGLTQAALSGASGVSLRAIQQYEQRKKDINRAHALSVWHLAQTLDCKVEDLLEP